MTWNSRSNSVRASGTSILRELDQPAQPVQTQGRKALALTDLPILHLDAEAQHGVGLRELAAANVNHRHLEVRERQAWVQGERAGGGVQSGVAPRGVAQPEQMPPLRRLEGNGAPGGGRGFGCLPRADQDHRERGVRLGEALVQLDGAARVRDGVGEQRVVGLRVEPRALVDGKLRGGETGVREGVASVDGDGAREIRHRAGERARVEGLDLEPPLGPRPRGLQARGLPDGQSRDDAGGREAEGVREVLHEVTFQREEISQWSVDLGLGERLAGGSIDKTRRNPNPAVRPVKGAQNEQPRLQRGGQVFGRTARTAPDVSDARSVHDLKVREGAQIAGHGVRDPRGQPRALGIATEVVEVQHGDTARIERGERGRGRGIGRGGEFLTRDGGDETIAAPCDRLDVPGGVGVIADGAPQLRDGLKQRVVGHVSVRPEGRQERVLGHQRAGMLEQVDEQVEQLRCDVDRVAAAPEAVGDAVDEKRPKPVGGGSHRSWRKMLPR